VPHYKRAPIVEAIIELQCQLPPETTITELDRMCEKVKATYPKKNVVVHGRAQFGPDVNSSAVQQQIGYRLDSEENRQIVQVRLDTFAFSRLAPYDRWETFREAAQPLWQVYRELFSPRIDRVGVRYINRIDIPSESAEGINLDDYFLTAPKISPELPQRMTNYFMRLQVPMKSGVSAIVTQTGAPAPGPGLVSTILDIDLFFQEEGLDERVAWTRIEELRHDKNRVFEACITDRVRDLIN
jgi:uncharacterized protein (TIGR04255 family)